MPLGLAIVGCGGAAVDVVRAVGDLPGIRIVAVHDRDRSRASDLAERTGGARFHAELRSLLVDREVDAVYVALPHDRLAPTAGAALRAGRHVLVEKPAATTLAALRGVRAVATAAGRSVGVVFELRHAPAVDAARELVLAGAIGDVTQIRIRTLIDKPPTYWESGPTGRAVDPWRSRRRRAGGGVILMNAIHQLDLVRWITGLDVERVAAETSAGVRGVEVEDQAAVVLRYRRGASPTGAVGSLVAAAHAPGASGGEQIEIDGTLGALRLPDPYLSPAPPLRLFLRRPWRDHAAGSWLSIERPAVDPWAAALAGFADAIEAGRPPVPGLDDAETALATVLAIYRSAAIRRTVSIRPSTPEEATHA